MKYLVKFMSTTTYQNKAGIGGARRTGLKRFYKKIGITEQTVDSSSVLSRKLYNITLDNKTLKTSLNNKLRIPSKSLAMAIAHEWDAQHNITGGIRTATMPLMTLMCTSIDNKDDKKHIIQDLMHYLSNDTICFHASKKQKELYEKQMEELEPIRKWIEKTFNGKLHINNESICRLNHSNELINNVKKYLAELDIYQLTGVRCITRECKSLSVALALEREQISAEKAVEISRTEEEFQINNWGLVEGGHDLDRVNTRVNVLSASIFLRLIKTESQSIEQLG